MADVPAHLRRRRLPVGQVTRYRGHGRLINSKITNANNHPNNRNTTTTTNRNANTNNTNMNTYNNHNKTNDN